MKNSNFHRQVLIVFSLIGSFLFGCAQLSHFVSEVFAANSNPVSVAGSGGIDNRLNPFAISPDGNTLARIDNSGGSVVLLDLPSGQTGIHLVGQSGDFMTDVVFGSDGKTLVSIGSNSISLWDIATGDKISELSSLNSSSVQDLVVGPINSVVAVIDRNSSLYLWNPVANSVQTMQSEANGSFSSIALSADGSTLASASESALVEVTIWDTTTTDVRASGIVGDPGSETVELVFNADASVLAAVGADGKISILDPSSADLSREILSTGGSQSKHALNSDGTTIARGRVDGRIELWSINSGQLVATLPNHSDAAINSVLFGPNGNNLVAVNADFEIGVWDLSSGQVRNVLIGHDELVGEIAFRGAQADRLTSISADGEVIVWELTTGSQQLVFQIELPSFPVPNQQGLANADASAQSPDPQAGEETVSTRILNQEQTPNPNGTNSATQPNQVGDPDNRQGIVGIAVSPDGENYACSEADGTVRIINAESRQEIVGFQGHNGTAVTGVVFTSDGTRIITGGRDTEVRSWAAQGANTGDLDKVFLGHEHPIRGVAVSPNGRYIASVGEEARVMLWDSQIDELSKILIEGHNNFVNAVSFSSDGAQVASGGADFRVVVWNVSNGQRITTLLGHSGEVNAVAFNVNGQILASGDSDGRVIFWDIATGQQLHSYVGHQGPIRSIAFHPDGNSFVSTGDDKKILVLNTGTFQLANQISVAAGINAIVFDQDGNLVVGDETGHISVWDTNRGIRMDNPVSQAIPGTEIPQYANYIDSGADHDDLAGIHQGQRQIARAGNAPDFGIAGAVSKILDWLVPTAEAALPGAGPGGPILIVTSNCPSCGIHNEYYAEILLNEGLNEFTVEDINNVNAGTLAGFDVVILGSMPLSVVQATMFSDWVNTGGNLIAMRPDADLAATLGLTPSGTTLAEGYMLVDTSQSPGNGIVNRTMQYHGTADLYTLNGASTLATLYSDATTATTNPALTLNSFGAGQAAAFTYDLATSVVYTRQGNPAWEAQERDGFPPIRSDDKYFGNAAADPQPDWVDLTNNVDIPQADEQQRLLVNLVLQMNLATRPLPRFWYFPRGERAVLVMTGDDHANNGTEGRFDQFIALSAPGCSVEDWECVRGTSYIYNGIPGFNILSLAQAEAYNALGFEVGLHVNTGALDYTAASLEADYSSQVGLFVNDYPTIPAPITMRHHAIVWSDWATGAEVMFNHGIRLDTDYYFWPAGWVQNRPGYFNGTAMAMRFARLDGSLIDVYQAASQMTDESGQTYPFTVDTLLDFAVGPEGYYGAYVINAHTDVAIIPEATLSVQSAQARGVPIITSVQLLDWLDAKNASSFSAINWNGSNILDFTVNADAGANGIQALIPANTAGGVVTSISDGSPVTFTIETIKGVQYATFLAPSGTYTATYGADTVAPTVTSTDPVNGATDVAPQAVITVTFSEPMDAATINNTSFQISDGINPPVAATVSYDAGNRTASLTPNSLLDAFVTYTATVSTAVTDLAGNSLASAEVWTFTTGDGLDCPCSVWDNSVVPTNTNFADPGPIEVGVKFQSDLAGFISGIRFYQENVGSYTVNLWTAGGVSLATGNFTVVTPGWQEVNISPVAITPNTTYVASYFAVNGGYAVNAGFFSTSGVENFPIRLLDNSAPGGNGVFAYNATSVFPDQSFDATNYWVDVVYVPTTGPDTTPPTVTSQNPAPAATDVALTAVVTATFSEGMDSQTINGSNFELRDAGNNLVPGAVTYDAVSSTATFTPTNPLAEITTYTATVTTGVTDIAGNALAAASVWSFTTGTGPTCPCSLWDDSTVPTAPSFNDPTSIELGVKFSSDVDGFITGIRFYQANPGAYIVNLWDINGINLATQNFTVTTGGWQQVDLSAPVAITANTNYVASYFTATGNYAVDTFFFVNSGFDNAPLHALQDGEDGGNGVFTAGPTSAFPTTTFGSANYWVDVVFEEDITPLEVLAQTPAPGAADLPTNTQVTATFNKDLNPVTVNASTVELRDPGNTLVPATITYDSPTKTITLVPNAPLAENAAYSVKIRGGATDPRVRDLSGISLVTDFNWSFTTISGCNASTDSIWPTDPTPAIIADPDATSIEIGVKFRSDVDGIICGLRFYKAPTNTGTHVGTLWSPTGQNLGSVTFTNETASGWQRADFATPVAVNADTVYTASYLAPVGQYSLNENFFTTAGVTSGPLTALSQVESGGNGVYEYGPGGVFPTNSFNSSNYWVDVVFAANSTADTVPPTVTSVAPADTTTGVNTETQLSAVFSEAIDPASINNTTFLLQDSIGSPVTGTMSVSFNTATFVPSAPLAENTLYTATLKGGAGNISDLVGNLLASDFVWSFTTGGSPCAPGSNPIVCENSFPGNPPSEWDVIGAGDPSIQGFATEFSVNLGETVGFKIDTPSTDYRLEIYRMGYYGGDGARLIDTVEPTATLPQNQPACLTDATGLIDCGNWGESASWPVPTDATSGIYFVKAVREDGGSAGLSSHIFFVVRDDASTSDLLFQTSDTTWQAYNNYGGNSLYVGNGPGGGVTGGGRAYKVSYNRPFVVRENVPEDSVFNAEYPMVRWLEANGYEVSYFSGIDTDRRGGLIANHKTFLSVGHDEYWSGTQRTNIEGARDSGINVAFFGGNSVYWKTRWETSIDGSGTPYRTLVCYKETHEDAKIDPSPEWTGTWRDPRFGPHDGGQPENGLTGVIFGVNGIQNDSITVPEPNGKLRFWNNTSIESLASGNLATLPAGTLGFEWDVVDIGSGFFLDNEVRPAGLIQLSSTTIANAPVLIDLGSVFGNEDATHALTLYRAVSGALVFGAGTVQWSWGLDSNHDRSGTPISQDMQQATVNLLADMGAQPDTMQAGLVPATATADVTAPTSVIVSPAAGATVPVASIITITGTATDVGGEIGGVEISVDGGLSWNPVTGLSNWTYDWNTPAAPATVTILTRAVDDSGNLESPGAGNTVTVASGIDLTPPTVIAQNPIDGATDVPLSGIVIATFSEAMNPASVTAPGAFELRDAGNVLVPATVNYSGVTATLTPNAELQASSTYSVTVKGGAGGVEDLAGNVLTADVTWQFTTGTGIVTCSSGANTIWSPSDTPAVVADPDTGGIELGVKFRSTAPGSVCGIRFYKSATNTGTHVGSLWDASGQLLASATFTGETASGWQQVDFASPVTIAPNTTYIASYFAPNGQYSIDDGYFINPGEINNPPLIALDNTVLGGNGVFRYGSGGLVPNNSFNASNYWVDVAFIPGTGNDTDPPVVTSRTPADTATGIGVATTVSATFDAALDPASVNATTFELRDPGNVLVPATVTYSGITATLTPTSPLAASTTYTATLVSGASGIKDIAGNELVADDTWQFTTAAAGTCSTGTSSLFAPTQTPLVPADPDTSAIEIGMKFSADQNGFICGIRFYKDASNTGTHIGNLWSATGQLLATATFINESPSGWQEVLFAAPVAVTANTTYIASYHAPAGRYSVDDGFFANELVNGLLRGLQDGGASGGNGVYQYGPTGFPTNTFNASNYWVDVVFTQ